MPAIIVDPALQAAVIRQFNLRGELAPFNLTENVIPVFDIGKLTALADTPTVVTTLLGSQGVRVGTAGAANYIPVEGIPFDDGDITNSGVVVNPAAAQVIVDGGAVGATATFEFNVVMASNGALGLFEIQWRNAANTATLATWGFIIGSGGPATYGWGPFVLNLAISERIRVVTVAAIVGSVNATVQFVNVANSTAN